MRSSLWIWSLIYLAGTSLGARILVYLPSLSLSHHFVYRPVLQALANRGHHITYVTGKDWKDRPANVEQRLFDINLMDIISESGGNNDEGQTMEEKVTNFSPLKVAKTYNSLFQIIIKMCFEHSITQDLVRSDEKYDLLMSEAMRGMEGIAVFQHRFNATGVVFQTRGDNAWANELIGLPDNPAYMVDAKTGQSDHMDFWERLYNAYITLASNWLSYQNLLGHQALVDKYVRYDGWESRPPLSQLIADQGLVLSNSHISAGYAYPKAPNFKEVGGTNVPEPKPLPEEMEKQLSDADNGLIYFSMGSNMDLNNLLMGADNLRWKFLTAFAGRKEKVFWRMSGKVKEEISDNVNVSPWFPQIDVLSHNRTKVFITHGGMLSVMESVSQGVPIIGIPIFGDQRKNILQAVESGYGILLEVANITEASIQWAIDEVIGNPRYKENAVKRSRIFYDRPMKPVDEAVYWIEYVLRHGKVLQPASARLTFYQIYLLDVFAFGAAAVVVFIILARKALPVIAKGLCKSKHNKYKSD